MQRRSELQDPLQDQNKQTIQSYIKEGYTLERQLLRTHFYVSEDGMELYCPAPPGTTSESAYIQARYRLNVAAPPPIGTTFTMYRPPRSHVTFRENGATDIVIEHAATSVGQVQLTKQQRANGVWAVKQKGPLLQLSIGQGSDLQCMYSFGLVILYENRLIHAM